MSAVVEAILSAAAAGDWRDFDPARMAERQQAEISRDREILRAEAAIVGDALQGPAGDAFVKWLIGKTLYRPPGPLEVQAQTAEAYAIAKARREGQNGMTFMILEALAVARGVQSDGDLNP